MLSFHGVMFELTGTEVSCTHQPCIFIFDIALIYSIHHYILMCFILSFQLVSSSYLLQRMKPGGAVEQFLMQSVQVVYIGVC